jgi:streptomycin 6-kinase
VGEPLGLRPLPRRAARDPVELRIRDLQPRADEFAARWRLNLGEPYDAQVGLVLRAERADGTRVVLKLNLVDEENEHEARALAFWGDAAVGVLEHDDEVGVLLLERAEPGTTLWELSEDEALPIAARVLRRLFDAGDPGLPFRRLEDEAPQWIEKLATRPFEPALLDEALAALHELPATQRDPVLVSEDFHGGNVLLAGRGWLAIDPKPIVASPSSASSRSCATGGRWTAPPSATGSTS